MVLGVPILEYFRVCEQSTVKVSESDLLLSSCFTSMVNI